MANYNNVYRELFIHVLLLCFTSFTYSTIQPCITDDINKRCTLFNNTAEKLFDLKDRRYINSAQLLTIIEVIPREYKITFEACLTSFSYGNSYSGWSNLFDFTTGNFDTDANNKYSYRVLSMFVNFNGDILFIANNNRDVRAYPISNALTLGCKQFEISQLLYNGYYNLSMQIDGINTFVLKNEDAKEFKNVKMYFSNPWYIAQPGYIEKLSVTKWYSELFNLNERRSISIAQLLTTFEVFPIEYKIIFEVCFNSFNYGPVYSNLFDFTTGNFDKDTNNKYSYRVLSMFIDANGTMLFVANTNGEVNAYLYKNYLTAGCKQFEISQLLYNGYYNLFMNIDGVNSFGLKNGYPKEFNNVKMYFSNPWYMAQPGYIEKLSVIQWYSEACNGYTFNKTSGLCEDNNECLTSNPCFWNNSICSNTIGSYLCSCANGWLLGDNKSSCVDNDECLTSNPCFWNSICNNTIGSYVCSCTSGWLLADNKSSCVDTDECLTSNPCFWNNSICKNTIGSYLCSCANGWQLGDDKSSCVVMQQANGNKTYIIAAAVSVPLLVVIIAFLVVLRIRSNRKSVFEKTQGSCPYIYSNPNEYYKVSADEWKISSKNIALEKKIGEGAFGNVFVAKINANILAQTKYFNKTTLHIDPQNVFNTDADVNVAVKFLNDQSNQLELNDFIEEITLMKDIGYHRNVVNMIGCSTIGKSLCLIVEYMQEGDLLHFLKNKRKHLCLPKQNLERAASFVFTSEYLKTLEPNGKTQKESPLEERSPLTPIDLLCFAWQVASGMEYLSCMKLVHRDLAARNILVGADKSLKISDFGLTRKVNRDVYMSGKSRRLPVKWMSIEAIFDRTFTSASDVWSYGVVLFEIVTLGETPYPTYSNKELLKLLKSGYRMDRPGNCSEKMYDIMVRCWNENPSQRPTFTELSDLLDKILSGGDFYVSLNINEKIYTNLDFPIASTSSDCITAVSKDISIKSV